MIFTPLQKLPKNGQNWGKLIVAKAFKKLPKVQNIAQSGHTDLNQWHAGLQHAVFYPKQEVTKSKAMFKTTLPKKSDVDGSSNQEPTYLGAKNDFINDSYSLLELDVALFTVTLWASVDSGSSSASVGNTGAVQITIL